VNTRDGRRGERWHRSNRFVKKCRCEEKGGLWRLKVVVEEVVELLGLALMCSREVLGGVRSSRLVCGIVVAYGVVGLMEC
jgi:hypothetical protein